MRKALPVGEECMEALLATSGEHQYKGKQRQNHEHAQFEVAASIEEVIPGPKMLREGHGAERNSGEDEQNPAEDCKDSCLA